ncbi:MAG: DUF2779 domain-containing protein [Syntrophorhabdaceae bacterium]|nr:DUF2779 domain-containing protein [Syntrophorhabdaceae bacterium]MDD5244640.1 DUF2779 domain-containing protein [Syntrophorhabdaceae bacterium]
MNNDLYLSKSLFIRGLQCHKSLYLHKHHPELKDETPPSRQALFQSGSAVGIVAQDLFPGGTTIPYDHDTYDRQVALTQEAINQGATTLYEAAFRFDDVFVKVDILNKGKDGWDIYEVKSSTSIKDVYVPDAAVQYYVVKGSGLPVSRVFLVHINNQYVREGEIEVEKLFTVNDVTREVQQMQNTIEGELDTQKTMLRGDMPQIDIGPYCTDPYDCDFIGHCWGHIPKDSVFTIRGSKSLPFTLYNRNIIELRDVPLHMLSANQKLQVEATLEKKIIISKEAIRDFLGSLWYPLYFLDFETFGAPIPFFDGTRPYQQVPFQYSLHYLEDEDANVKHHEYLAVPKIDPREELTKKLVSEIPHNACVLAYYAGFEAGVLQGLAGWLPKYQDDIDTILNNLRDLAVPFQKKVLYHWQFNGSYSLKYVLPALVPDLSYKDMEIQDGDMAMQAYFRMQESSDPREIKQLRDALLAYCSLDTLGMVRIIERLKEMADR